MESLKLTDLRSALIRQEETIIFAMIERAQFCHNPPIYEPGAIAIPDFDGSFSDYLLQQTEHIHARVRRYTSPDEHAFFGDLPDPILPSLAYSARILDTDINVNDRIRQIYQANILPAICPPGDDGHYGSSATCDVACLQALSKRIHYGKYVAECKYQEEAGPYTELVVSDDRAGILDRLTKPEVEDAVLERVRHKAAAYGRDIAEESAGGSDLDPTAIQTMYRDYIIPLTKDVEIDYLMLRAHT